MAKKNIVSKVPWGQRPIPKPSRKGGPTTQTPKTFGVFPKKPKPKKVLKIAKRPIYLVKGGGGRRKRTVS